MHSKQMLNTNTNPINCLICWYVGNVDKLFIILKRFVRYESLLNKNLYNVKHFLLLIKL